MGWIAFVADTDTGHLEMLPALIIGSAGLTMAMPAAQKAVVGAVQPREIGQASGAFMMLRILGGVFGTYVTVAVFAGVGGYASAEEFSAGFSAGMTAVAALAFVGALVALGIPGKRPASEPVPSQSVDVPTASENALSPQTRQ